MDRAEPKRARKGAFYASEWVGIDGWNSADVLQAGTETQVTEILWFRIKNVYVWWEWFPSGEVAIDGRREQASISPLQAAPKSLAIVPSGLSSDPV